MLAELQKTREELQEQFEIERLRAEISAFQTERNIHRLQLEEVGSLMYGDIFRDEPFHGGTKNLDLFGEFKQSELQDRHRGKWEPVFSTETDLAEIRGICRVLSAIDEVTIGIGQNLGNYILGTGYGYDVSAKQETPESAQAARLVGLVIQEFVERTKRRRCEREAFDRSRRDGESFEEIVPLGSGYSRTRFVEPDAIVEPHGNYPELEMFERRVGVALDWSFGIATTFNDATQVHGYFVDMTGDQRAWRIVPCAFMNHIKRNVDANVKRGVSDYYPAWRNLQRRAKISRNVGEGAALQAAIAWIREHAPGVTKSQVEALNFGKREMVLDRTTSHGDTIREISRHYKPGTILDVPRGQQYKPGPMGSERNNNLLLSAEEIGRSLGQRWCMPEFMVTGVLSGNFASSLVAEAPFVKFAKNEQVDYEEEYVETLWKVTRLATSTRTFRSIGLGDVARLRLLVKIKAILPRVEVRNELEETNVREKLHRARIMSAQTWARLANLDFEHEQKMLAIHEPALSADRGPSMPGEIAPNQNVQGRVRDDFEGQLTPDEGNGRQEET